jgi:hypothetical protein
MAELSGALGGIGFPRLVRFLADLQKSGCLRISQADGASPSDLAGELCFDQGQLVTASFGRRHGLGALDAIVSALSDGQFTFLEGAPPAERNVELSADRLLARLDALVTGSAVPPSGAPTPPTIFHARPGCTAATPRASPKTSRPRSSVSSV